MTPVKTGRLRSRLCTGCPGGMTPADILSLSVLTLDRVTSSMLISFLLLIGGFIGLLGGGELTVRGASAVAARLRINPYVIGATVIAFGTSAPELVVTLTASFRGSTELALGNVVGSNIANLGLILGLTATVGALTLNPKTLRGETPAFIAVVILLTWFAWDGTVGRTEGLILLAGGVGTGAMLYFSSRQGDGEPEIPSIGLVLSIVFILFGFVGLIGGAQLLVEGAVRIAEMMGVPEWVIGVGVVAVGTSLPEVAASLVAAFKGQGEIAVGNVIGSNAFNVFLVLGLGGTLQPIRALSDIRGDLIFLFWESAFVLAVLYLTRGIPRWSGLLLLIGYAVYVGVRFSGA
ncbi:sodium:calcium antiporter [bacterium]|nr:sodium:calcium antiporter [bacterium]